MLPADRAWALERNGRRLVFAAGAGMTLFGESGGFRVTRHDHPVWKVVLPVTGPTWIGHVAAAGLVVPPQLAHTCVAESGYVALFVDPWLMPPGRGPVRLAADTVRRLHAALGPGATPDLAAAYRELVALTGPVPALDARVAHAVRQATHPGHDTSVQAIAAAVGLSPPRLRTLVRESVGVPLARLRQWGRLRNAIADLPAGNVAAAAATAGFADQSHLTRTARSLLGRTPLSLMPTR